MSFSKLISTKDILTYCSGYHTSKRVGIPHTSITRHYTSMNQDKAVVEESENIDEKV